MDMAVSSPGRVVWSGVGGESLYALFAAAREFFIDTAGIIAYPTGRSTD
jgi:hypothetical protein